MEAKKPPVQPKIVMKGTQEFRHDLYKLQVADCEKNLSWKPGEPRLEKVAHTHFFHSHSMRGLPHKYSTNVAGHFHEITTTVDETGRLIAQCGPALKKIETMGPGDKTITEIVPIEFKVKGKSQPIQDAHAHDVKYLYSENLSQEKLRAMQEAESTKVKNMGVKITRTQDPVFTE